MSARAAASVVGVSAPTWSGWESGKKPIPIQRVALIEDVLECEKGALFGVRLREVFRPMVEQALDARTNDFLDEAVELALRLYRELWHGDWRDGAPPVPEDG